VKADNYDTGGSVFVGILGISTDESERGDGKTAPSLLHFNASLLLLLLLRRHAYLFALGRVRVRLRVPGLNDPPCDGAAVNRSRLTFRHVCNLRRGTGDRHASATEIVD
jgi:hypothetical protein